ncbi:AraC family transcriptional regulator [Clostridium sp.]|jgi:YesN/AraC family two-component response regulator|uniref:AraC family transcriptional regulator n=1 Tax=Clostridium sp. TaxID=1506 RepID=UPI002845DBA4|nr:AraC family transcriptional regulator [Clostridium sp.]MDR3598397.1 AraC family transcriptional regulator [Clostridium sp.]
MFFSLNPNTLPQIRLMNCVTIEIPYIHQKRKADEYILYIIRKGTMYLMENGEKYVLKEGDFFLLEPSYTHKGYKASYCEYYYIHFKHADIHRIEKSLEAQIMERIVKNRVGCLQSNSFSYEIYERENLFIPKKYKFFNYSSFTKTICLLNEAIEQNRNQIENYKILCSCKVLEAFIEVARSFVFSEIEKLYSKVPKSYKKVQELLKYLNTEYANKITSVTIEKQFACNFDYMNRLFKQLTQKTIFAYLNTIRINHAKELISTTSLKLSEISMEVGFNDEYYFSKVFKKYTGIPPTIYARGILKNRILQSDFC